MPAGDSAAEEDLARLSSGVGPREGQSPFRERRRRVYDFVSAFAPPLVSFVALAVDWVD